MTTLYMKGNLNNWYKSVVIREACEITHHQNKPIGFGTDIIVDIPEMEQNPFRVSDTQDVIYNRWRTKEKDWKKETTANSLYLAVLIWLAKKHDFGVEDWCQKLTSSRHSEFKITEGKPKGGWAKVDLMGRTSLYVRTNIGSDKKPFLLAEACKITCHQGKPIKPLIDLFVEMKFSPRQGKSG